MEKRYGLGLTAVVLLVAFMAFACASSKVAKQKEALVEVHKPVVVEKTGKDDRPEWTTRETFIEEDGSLIYTGGVVGGADYALTLRLARSEATKNLLESIQIKARVEFSSAIHGQNRSESDLGRYVTDAVAWTVDNLKIQGIMQKASIMRRSLTQQTRRSNIMPGCNCRSQSLTTSGRRPQQQRNC
jgi:hypothetical protein